MPGYDCYRPHGAVTRKCGETVEQQGEKRILKNNSPKNVFQ